MLTTFDLLAPFVKKKIWEQQWKHFTPVQEKAIPAILNTDKDVIISSATASGKTEAAFLPILSKVVNTAPDKLKILYISPLKALINDQFERITDICESSYIPIHRWHGDVSGYKKKAMLKQTAGILQITPESMESLFINRTNELANLFHDVEFVIIDEIHAFINEARGVHLRSLLSRMEAYTTQRPRIIGLSATIDNFDLVKQWTRPGDPDQVEVIKSEAEEKKLLYHLLHVQQDGPKKPIELLQDMRELTRNQKALIFCNNRGSVEEITYFLNRLAKRENHPESYFAHHSSIDKSEREFVEKSVAATKMPKSIVATSSLELGIDIGSIDLVIQLDNTFSVSSLKQRLGRSGRKADSHQMLQLYTTDEDSLLQSLAVMELNLEGWIEPAEGYALPYDILFQQIISICAETNGITEENLITAIKRNQIFFSFNREQVQTLLEKMIEDDILEQIRGTHELIVGLEGERILRGRDFYGVFISPQEFEVIHGSQNIGTLDQSQNLIQGDNFILAGKLWTITEINEDTNKIHVTPAVDGNPPRYISGGGKMHPKIGEKISTILYGNETFAYVDRNAQAMLDDQRHKYHEAKLTEYQRPLWIQNNGWVLETFSGTKITRTLAWMLKTIGAGVTRVGDYNIEGSSTTDIADKWQELKEVEWQAYDLFAVTNYREIFMSKYSRYLPESSYHHMHEAHEVDLAGALDFLRNTEIKVIHQTIGEEEPSQ
ncbi:DEAD/DEAH box helicase [Salicibibacter kimchii]|uniref:DEAD/DEAH box helicase n=1 Tax=Salicibibacter kimchii TaxID=2099786 RepID=A0A345BXB9_9BACI|nr:DEAD/DEAH box helicase [Salicibibacter kimchii]AXF55600.1 DEAD/DEAH box helicase [Salicibibacter kimchii]